MFVKSVSTSEHDKGLHGRCCSLVVPSEVNDHALIFVIGSTDVVSKQTGVHKTRPNVLFVFLKGKAFVEFDELIIFDKFFVAIVANAFVVSIEAGAFKNFLFLELEVIVSTGNTCGCLYKICVKV